MPRFFVDADHTPALPWVAPTAPFTRLVLDSLDRPLRAWDTGQVFDVEDFYEGTFNRSPLDRAIRAAGNRNEWRIEDVPLADHESSPAERALYEQGVKTIGGFMFNPLALDHYVMQAYSFAESAGLYYDEYMDNEDASPPEIQSPSYRDAMAWAEAGVCVLQQSLPWPFLDCLPSSVIDNRPAHRLLNAYAKLLGYNHPRKAGAWFKAIAFIDPPSPPRH